MRRVSFSRPGSSHRFAKDFERIGGRGLTRGPDPCREELFKALDINLRQQPAIEGTAWRQKQAGAKDLAQQTLVLKAPLAHRLGAVTVTEQRGDQAGQQKWEIIAQPVLATGIRDGFHQFAERRQMGCDTKLQV